MSSSFLSSPSYHTVSKACLISKKTTREHHQRFYRSARLLCTVSMAYVVPRYARQIVIILGKTMRRICRIFSRILPKILSKVIGRY